jgi:hypothetical protein
VPYHFDTVLLDCVSLLLHVLNSCNYSFSGQGQEASPKKSVMFMVNTC